MQQRSEDTWLPTYDDEEASEDLWQGEGADDVHTVGPAEDEVSPWDDSHSRGRARRDRDDESASRLRAVLGVFLVVLLGISAWWGVRALLLPAASTPTPAALWTPVPLASPIPTSTPAQIGAEETQSPAAAPMMARIAVGQQVRVAGTDQEGIRLRNEPGTGYDTLLIVEEGVELQVLGGPQEADGYTWWQLQMDDSTVGWAVQDWLEPVP